MNFTTTSIVSGILFLLAFGVNIFAYILEKKVNKKKLDIIEENKIKNKISLYWGYL